MQDACFTSWKSCKRLLHVKLTFMSNGVAPFKLLWVVNKTDETLNYIDETEYSY